MTLKITISNPTKENFLSTSIAFTCSKNSLITGEHNTSVFLTPESCITIENNVTLVVYGHISPDATIIFGNNSQLIRYIDIETPIKKLTVFPFTQHTEISATGTNPPLINIENAIPNSICTITTHALGKDPSQIILITE